MVREYEKLKGNKYPNLNLSPLKCILYLGLQMPQAFCEVSGAMTQSALPTNISDNSNYYSLLCESNMDPNLLDSIIIG